MSAKERLVYAIIKFLASEAQSHTDEEKREGIEVARQCLETAYGIEHGTRAELELPAGLEEIIADIPPVRVAKEVTAEDKTEAERLKNAGNEFMKAEQFIEAVNSYTQAIAKDPNNAIYYSNRAAAYNKLERYYEAAEDCDEAIMIDPNYSKAYGRKGLALSGLNQHTEAIKCYKKGIELDPNNQNFKTNLEIAEEKARTAGGQGPGGLPGMPGGFGSLLGGGGGGMPDLGAILNNPAMMNMAAQMMQNPAMQQMMNNMMTGMGGGGGGNPGAPPAADPSSAPAGGPPGGMDNLLRAGQQLAEQLQSANPELVNQLRNQFQGAGMGNDGADQPPNNGSS